MIGAVLSLALVAAGPPIPLSITTTDDALAAFANPAALGVTGTAQLSCIYKFRSIPEQGLLSHFALAAKAGPLGAFWSPESSRFGFALGAGGGGMWLGARYASDTIGHLDLGALARPLGWLSLGLLWQDATYQSSRLTLGAAVRPIGDRLSLFAEAATAGPFEPAFGIEAEPFDGFKVGARALLHTKTSQVDVGLGLLLELGRVSVGAGWLGGLLSVSSDRHRTFVYQPRRHLDLTLSGTVSDQQPGFSLGGSPSRLTWDLLDLINRAARDSSIRALVLDLSDAALSFDQVLELREGLLRFKAGGRKLYVYGGSLDMATYALASLADRIAVAPVGDVSIPGVSAQVMFLKGALDKFGLKADYTRHGKYKSAVETFSEDSLTGPNREQLTALVDTLYGEWMKVVSAGRGLKRDSLEKLVSTGMFTARDAQAAGLVDRLCYREEFDSIVKKDLGGISQVGEKSYRQDRIPDLGWQLKPAIAIVYASGDITGGESGTDFLSGSMTMGAQTMVKAIRAAAGDKRVKAILLRINSPGGDGYASDLIWHELEKARAKKPIIVSMGSLAASGGYYIACNASRIFALPTTITGSIGVFDLKLVTEGLYNKLGARRQTIRRGEHADAGSDAREWTPQEDSMIQAIIDQFYQGFVGKVAQGRHMTAARVDSIAQGRVWSGADGKRVGIVDELGGFLQAVDYAKQAAKLKDCDFVFYPKPKTGLADQLGRFAATQLLNLVRGQ